LVKGGVQQMFGGGAEVLLRQRFFIKPGHDVCCAECAREHLPGQESS
jgi:hypothetical protein